MESKPPEDLAPLLAKVEVLGPLSEHWALWLARRTTQRRFEPGQIIYGPAYNSTIVFALLEGRVRLYKSVGGEELTLEMIEAGQLFGDVPALAGRRPEVYAEALLPSRVVLLNSRVMTSLLRENPGVGRRLAERLADRLYEYQQRMADVALKKVRARLASVLVRLFQTEGIVDREGVKIDTHYTHEQLATMIGSKRVAVTRAFRKLEESGAVELKDRRIIVKDIDALKALAETS